MKTYIRSMRQRQLFHRNSDRNQTLDRAMRRLLRWTLGSRLPVLAVTDAIYGWGNEIWSADEDYLIGVISEAASSRGPIIECGSGLSTILLALVARQTGLPVHSLEHNEGWRERVIETLAVYDLVGNNVVHHAPLQSYGEYGWYTLPASLPTGVSLIICDGPPADTNGGRFGVLPLLRERFAPACTILLDDASRLPGMNIIARWEDQAGVTSQQLRMGRGCARVTVVSN